MDKFRKERIDLGHSTRREIEGDILDIMVFIQACQEIKGKHDRETELVSPQQLLHLAHCSL